MKTLEMSKKKGFNNNNNKSEHKSYLLSSASQKEKINVDKKINVTSTKRQRKTNYRFKNR